MKTENREASGGHCKAGCCHPGLCSRPWHLPRGGCILCPAGRFQLTCWECPQWVTTFNSIGAICCPLGCFWTAAWLRTQLVTGNVTIVWLIFKLGRGGGGVRGRKRERRKPNQERGQLNFSGVNCLGRSWERRYSKDKQTQFVLLSLVFSYCFPTEVRVWSHMELKWSAETYLPQGGLLITTLCFLTYPSHFPNTTVNISLALETFSIKFEVHFWPHRQLF